MNPPNTLRYSKSIIRVAVDQQFYYVGDTIKINISLDNSEAEYNVNSVEVSLSRTVECSGVSMHDKLDFQKFRDLFMIKT